MSGSERDAAHRLTQIIDKAGDTIEYSYDATSNLAAVNIYDPGKTLTYTNSYTYDQGNRLQTDTGATAVEKTTYVYDNEGNLLTRTDPLGHVSTYTYDALNRRASFLDPLHNKTIYSYNENDDLTAVIDPRGLATIYTYDGLDDQTGVRSPDTGVTTRIFDAAGNVLTSTDARDKVGTFKYDDLNRPLTITWTGGETIAYTYDTGADGIGHLTKMVDPAGTTNFTYNQLGQLLTKTQVIGVVTLDVTYAYDAFGRLSSLRYPSGKTITYSYDTSGRISALSTGAGSIAYFPFGPARSWTEPNGLTYARTFDKDGRIDDITLGGTVNMQTLTYDNVSRITHLTETGLAAKTYGYDNDDRLTDFINGVVTTKYTYDADSNRSTTVIPAGTTTYHYPTTSNRLASLSGFTAQTESYDASGNQTGDGTITYGYDARGRMSSSIAGGITTSYAINAFGQRIRKSGSDEPNGGANEYVYDEQGHLIGEYNSTGGIVNETVYLGNTPVAVLTGATVYSVSADWLCTPHFIQNSSKQDVWTWDHYAFGDTVPNQNPAGLGTFNYNSRFPGQHYDAESGLNYNTFRDYNPTLGRYVESDPIGLIAGINTYGYVGGNPLTRIDASGKNWIAVAIVVGGGSAFGAWREGSHAYECGARGWALATAIAQGAAAGIAGSFAGLFVADVTKSPFLTGAAASEIYDITLATLQGKVVDPGSTLWNALGSALWSQGIDFVLPGIQGGWNYNPFKSPINFGPQAIKLYTGELAGKGPDVTKPTDCPCDKK